jgi:hypothetical protein
MRKFFRVLIYRKVKGGHLTQGNNAASRYSILGHPTGEKKYRVPQEGIEPPTSRSSAVHSPN